MIVRGGGNRSRFQGGGENDALEENHLSSKSKEEPLRGKGGEGGLIIFREGKRILALAGVATGIGG